MIKSTMAMFPRTLLWLICFALFCFLPGCGGSGSSGTDEEVTYTLTVATTPAVDTFQAGETVTITATVTGSDGLAASGQAVTFTVFRNNSGGTLNIAGTGTTDGDGRAQATYTLGSDDSADTVTDTIEVSIPGSTETITINRAGQTYAMVVSSDATTLAAGEVATITATVTDGNGDPASGQAVTFEITENNSGGTITISGTGTTDANGQATAFFEAGATDPTAQVIDTINVSAFAITKSVKITRVIGTSTDEAASLDLAAVPASIKTDGSVSSTITVNALNSGNAVLSGIAVTLTTDTGILSAPTITTPGNVTLSCGSNKANRTATITATSGEVTAQIPIQIIGSTITLTSDASSISTTGSANLTVTVKDASGTVVPGTTVTLTQSGTGGVTFGSATGTTNASGTFSTIANGSNNGKVTITATALGATATTALTVIDAATVFAIDQQRKCTTASCTFSVVAGNPNPTAMYLTQTLEIRVNAPDPIANVVFATTTGTFTDSANAANTGSVITVAVDGSNKATAYLTSTQAGVATVNVYNAASNATNDSLTVAMTSATADNMTVQATPTIVSKSVGTTTGTSTLIAMVRDASGYPVGNAPVLFTIVNPTGGGETISPVVVMTAATTAGGLNLGEARTSFTSGSLPSAASGVQIHAEVVGTTVETEPIGVNLTASGNDATIVIGGTAGSVAFGLAPQLSYYDDTKTQYVQAMSMLVTDANGNPAPAGTTVSLSIWPIAWSTGGGCAYDADFVMVDDDADPTTPDVAVYGAYGTFWNEDVNENLILDSTEDGTRKYYYYTPGGPAFSPEFGTVDGYITAVNSAAGSVPATVTTDENGVANFDLTYPLSSSIWTVVRVRASTIVQGTETVGQIIFRLNAMNIDVNPCHITGSPYNF